MNEWMQHKKRRVVYLRHRCLCGGIRSVRSVVPGSGTTSRDKEGKSSEGRRDTAELRVASRCTTQGNHKYEAKDGIAYVVFPFPPTEDTSAANHNLELSLG